MALSLSDLQNAVQGTAAAFRSITDYDPVGGPGAQVYPATYEGGQCAEDERIIDGARVPCVLLDSVQSAANRAELALLDAWERNRISLPVISVDFRHPTLLKSFKVTSLEVPHRIADALLRDSLHNGQPFRRSPIGARLDLVDIRNATPLFEVCPTALLFGMWDSTGPRGGLGAKFQRALVSEIVGINAVKGVRTRSRLDPAQILLEAGPLYESADSAVGWTLVEQEARSRSGKPVLFDRGTGEGKAGRPSKANHGNVTPSTSAGGYTIAKARQSTVLSLAALRRLRFPLGGESRSKPSIDDAARTALAALGLCAAILAQAQGADLRSRCQLVPTTPFVWELLDTPGQPPVTFSLSGDEAVALFTEALAAAMTVGLPWLDTEVELQPSESLLELVRRSQELAARQGTPVAEA